jgi:hypothetical protein
VRNALLQVSTEELQELPEPSSYNPSYWSFPEYARTPYKCFGDDSIGTYAADLIKSKRGQINFHVVSQGFLSATLPEQDANSIDMIDLPAKERDQLRTFLKFRIRDMEQNHTARTWVFRLAGVPTLPISEFLAWFIFASDIVFETTVGATTEDTTKRLLVLADELQSSAQIYRSIIVMKSAAGREYVRYLYAIKPNEREINVIRCCYYARR